MGGGALSIRDAGFSLRESDAAGVRDAVLHASVAVADAVPGAAPCRTRAVAHTPWEGREEGQALPFNPQLLFII